jgi:hypothetical protein
VNVRISRPKMARRVGSAGALKSPLAAMGKKTQLIGYALVKLAPKPRSNSPIAGAAVALRRPLQGGFATIAINTTKSISYMVVTQS